ncbi:MAG: carbonic anhydrase [Bacteroidales bacterium]|nr:carbonic anhydrase [Bacteroidota bacterium]MCF8347779.1 carbonic anhydrase [Bacteroidales bacterium]
MDRLIDIQKNEDILPQYQNTPIAKLLQYHNLGYTFEEYQNAQLLIGMCMDNRKHMNIPDNFAYIIRAGGANMRYSEFKVSYAFSVGGVKHMALIGHNHCAMVNLVDRKNLFVDGLVENAGWPKKQAEDHFLQFAPLFEIGGELDFLCRETRRLRFRYPKIMIAPMMYLVEDNKLYLVEETEE